MPKRVLLWSPKGAGLHYGGPGMNAFRLYSSDSERRFEVTLVHGSADQERFELFREQVLLSKLSGSALSQVRFIFKSKQWVKDNAHRFDVFHGLQGFELTVNAALQAKKSGLPAVVKLVSHRSDLGGKPGLKALVRLPERRRRAIRKLDAVIAISESIAKELLEYGIPEDRIARIPNGVDTEKFYAPSPSQRAQQRELFGWPELPTVVFVGALVKRKNPALLIEALERLRATGREAHLVLAGPESEPPYAMHLRELVERFRLTTLVTFLGHTQEIPAVYRAADLFTLPSSNEGMPNSLLEAMASGLPSVSTPISGVVDLVQDGRDGRLVPPQLEAFVEAMCQYLDSTSLRAEHGALARSKMQSQFSTQVVLERHLELFRKIGKN